MKMFRHLIVVLILLIVVKSGLAIHCWQCNSHLEAVCKSLPRGAQDKSALEEDIRNFYVDCDSLNDSFTGKYSLCRKQEQTVGDDSRTIRSCGFETSGRQCYSTANPPVKTWVCECKEDGCNLGSQLSFNQFLLFISLFLSITISYNCFYK